MNWIFPLAGEGKRTNSLGSFKPFISIKDFKIIEWFFRGIKKKIKPSDNLFFITTEEFDEKFSFNLTIKKILKKQKIKGKIFINLIKKTPKGPALTIQSIISILNNNDPCLIINSDQYIDFDLPKKINTKKIYLALHFNTHGKSSYVDLNKKGKITKIEEKKLISFYASSGVYIFGSCNLLKNSFRQFKRKYVPKEINMSDIINNYLKIMKLEAEPLATYFKYDLGNVESIKNFKNWIN